MTEPTTTTNRAPHGPAQGVRPERGRGPDLRALACRGRVPAGRSRLDGRSGPAAVHDHPAAAERDRVAPPRPRPADRGRGPDDPARANARASDAVPARSRPRVDRRAVRARRDPRRGRREPRVARPRAVPRADARVLELDEAGHARAAAACRGLGGLEPPPIHDGRGLGRAVRVAFERLYRDGLAYRTEALINWCPGCRTSVSDLEVIPTPETGTLWFVRYHLIDEATGQPDPDAWVTVATTRPETILGDTAVAVHPDDERYRDLVGRRVRIPFVERDVPVIADETVEREFGTGALKITPAHDHDDYATGRRHDLPMITVLDDDATINEAGAPFTGLDRYAARERIVRSSVPAATSRAKSPTRWSSAAASAATT